MAYENSFNRYLNSEDLNRFKWEVARELSIDLGREDSGFQGRKTNFSKDMVKRMIAQAENSINSGSKPPKK